MPASVPASTNAIGRCSTPQTTRDRSAPSAMRTPISGVRSLTQKDMTP